MLTTTFCFTWRCSVEPRWPDRSWAPIVPTTGPSEAGRDLSSPVVCRPTRESLRGPCGRVSENAYFHEFLVSTADAASVPRRVRRGFLVDHRRVLLELRFGPFRRRWGLDLPRPLLYLPADALQRRRDALR